MKRKIDHHMALPYFPDEEIDDVLEKYRRILAGEGMLSMGEYVRRFERDFADYVGVGHSVGVSSCSAALEIALRCIGVGSGDEIVVPVETFVATGSSIVREGATPVFAGINPDTFCLSAAELEKRITSRTKAAIVVHMAGLVTPEIHDIQRICRERGIALIEDAAHAPGAMYEGTKAGAFGDIACFSFYPTKVMTTSEGGMLVTDDEKLAKLADSFRNRGRDMDAPVERYTRLGTNNRMSEFAAILGLSQLSHLEDFIEARNRVASIYDETLKPAFDSFGVFPLPLPEGCRHSYWRYIVRISDGMDRDAIRDGMRERGIAVDWAYDPPLHLQPVFRELYGTHDGMLPDTEKVMKSFISLPIHVGITPENAQTISKALLEVIGGLYG